jgi:hypothetical protein
VREKQNQPFQLSFNASLKVDFQDSRVTSAGGLILVRELDERLGFSELIQQHLTDSRGKNTQLPLADLLRQSVSEEWVGKVSVLGFWDSLAAAEKTLDSKPGWCVAC